MPRRTPARTVVALGIGWLILGCGPARGDDATDLKEELKKLQEQNSALEQQLQKQQGLIDSLARQVGELQKAQTGMNSTGPSNPAGELEGDRTGQTASQSVLGGLHIGGEGGIAFLRSGSQGMYPNNEFRVDEARLFVEAPIIKDVYFYSEINFATPEEPDVQARLGELYLDFENVSKLWNRDHQLNVRVGRMYIPFGEEYLTRYAIDNPFVSRSLPDLWGVDEGVELYGRFGKFSYAAAVQNGGIPDTRDFNSDKSLAARVGFDPTPQLHLSVSAMRTGDLSVQQDAFSAMWFANGFFRSLGSPATTQFHVNLAQGDVQFRFPRGHLSAFGGYLHYDDNDPAAANGRDGFYYSAEGVYDIFGKLYAGVRFSQILSAQGLPLVGNGNFGEYFFGPLTTDLWRLSLDLGYRWSQNLLLKAEYSFERGKTVDGEVRNNEDLFALEAAFKF